jgi:hypothetical protein
MTKRFSDGAVLNQDILLKRVLFGYEQVAVVVYFTPTLGDIDLVPIRRRFRKPAIMRTGQKADNTHQ